MAYRNGLQKEESSVSEYIQIPAAYAIKQARIRERDRLWQARQRYRYPDKDKRSNHHGAEQKQKIRTAPFVMWDGEGPCDAGYALFGNSSGYEICHPFLGTEECLNLIIECEQEIPDAIHIGFGFNYDVSMILADLSRRHKAALHANTRVVWKDWEIEHIPHKWFKVQHGKVIAKIFDIRSFFSGGYLDALEDFHIGTDEEREHIRVGKEGRADFLWSEIRSIREYWLTELRLGPLLAESLRGVFGDAGYIPRSWHGPGALARLALKRHKIYDAMAECPVDVRIAAQYAFAGGRFELFKAGHMQGKVYNADIRSAYPSYATQLPNLSRGRWRRGKNYESGKFGIYHINYASKPDSFRLYPLFRRMPNQMVVWPYRVEGWYWGPEAELVANDSDAQFLESWIFDEHDESDRPFAWLAEYYYRRQRLKNNGSAAEYTFKLIINSVYGQLAQRAGWNKKNKTAPRSHQLEWAGFVTSSCRAAVYKIAASCGEKLISIDTDGISSLAPFDTLAHGTRLGEWELTEYDDGIFWQSGIYTLKTSDCTDKKCENYKGLSAECGHEWSKARTRGIPKGSYTAEQLLDCLLRKEPLRLSKKVFVTYGLADNGRPNLCNQWISQPHEFVLGGAGKRLHFERACETSCLGSIHRLGMPLWDYGPDGSCVSVQHWLPWLAARDDDRDPKREMDDLALFDANHLDFDTEWMRDYSHD
jgi:hypothetical protein